jgi:hypothetical protein
VRRICLLAVLVAFLPASAGAATILFPKSGGWEYTFDDPTGDATWNTTTGTPGWLIGTAPFGNQTDGTPLGDPLGHFNFNTKWDADGADGDDLWARRAVDLTGWDLNTVLWDLGVDNGFKLYMNGTLIASANGEGYTFRWEYSGNFAATLLPGINILAVALEDHGAATAFDMQITGDQQQTPIPEPGSVLLVLTGIAALRARLRSGTRP